ncbi:2-acylglycerol O-acyltransferase [Aureococcus anophagefferens]|nr:2-acylglycerol O-acyltransferase [Aureococcus anophagefferens]
MRQIPKYFRFEEYHELSDGEVAARTKSGERFVFCFHPHGVFPFVATTSSASSASWASAAVFKKRLARGSAALYVGGMLELFSSSRDREAVILSRRKGFVKLALRSGADLVPSYMFGNTTVLEALTAGPLAALSRAAGVSFTLFWGRWGLPLPRPVKLVFARGRPLGLPHIPEPTAADVDKYHALYCAKLLELFDNYKKHNPDYARKSLEVDAHYTDFFENWLAWLERSGVAGAVGLVAIAEDESAAAYLEAWAAAPPPGWHAYRRAVAPPAAGAAPLGGALGFETRGFATLMARRAAYLAAELAALAADGAWAKDPASRLVFSDLDVRNLPAFNAAARALRPRRARALPPETFCSAKRTFNRPKWAADAPRGAVTAHANWIDGHDAKRAALARSGAWLAAGATPLLVPAR